MMLRFTSIVWVLHTFLSSSVQPCVQVSCICSVMWQDALCPNSGDRACVASTCAIARHLKFPPVAWLCWNPTLIGPRLWCGPDLRNSQCTCVDWSHSCLPGSDAPRMKRVWESNDFAGHILTEWPLALWRLQTLCSFRFIVTVQLLLRLFVSALHITVAGSNLTLDTLTLRWTGQWIYCLFFHAGVRTNESDQWNDVRERWWCVNELVAFLNAAVWKHRRSQGEPCPPHFLEHLVILCFERRCPKENSFIRLKSIIRPPMFGTPSICKHRQSTVLTAKPFRLISKCYRSKNGRLGPGGFGPWAAPWGLCPG